VGLGRGRAGRSFQLRLTTAVPHTARETTLGGAMAPRGFSDTEDAVRAIGACEANGVGSVPSMAMGGARSDYAQIKRRVGRPVRKGFWGWGVVPCRCI
jgi:hypothetical protein